jgi:hypothetical protein
VVTGALDRLRAAYDLVVAEGAGSPAEINLAQYDIVNMRVARHSGAPVLLVGDIDRGGVFASLYGTVALLPPEERAHVRGFVINKFRGDPTLLTPGFAMLEARTGVPTLGVLPYLDLSRVPAEDALDLDARGGFGATPRGAGGADAVLDVVVLRLPRIANLDEFQPLAADLGVRLRFVRSPRRSARPTSSSCPARRRRAPTSRGCASAGSTRRCARAAPPARRSSASAAGIRCSASRSPTRSAPKAWPERRPASGCCPSAPRSRPTRSPNG